MKTIPMMIPGASAEGEPLIVRAPYDLSEIASLERSGSSAIQKALQTATTLYNDKKSWIPLADRLEILNKTSVLILERAEDLAREAAHEGGKPLIDSRAEIARAADGVKVCIEVMRTQAGDVIPMKTNGPSQNRVAYTQREPIGVVVAASAFNHPFNLIAHQVVPAIAAGCPVIVKPAPDTPLSCVSFVNLLREAGLPEEWCQVVITDDNNLASELCTDARVGFFTFIGSAKVGWMLRSKLAPGTRCAFEHGGMAPVILEPDCDIQDALPKLAKGGFYHAGQVCVSVQRVLAHESIAQEVAEGLALKGNAYKVGNPILDDTDVGPLIRPTEVDRIEAWVNEAVSEGAKLLSGGKRISDTCYECSVLYNPSLESKVMKEEIFGPVVCVTPYKDLDEAIAIANSLPYAFQSSVFTKNIDKAFYAANQFEAATVLINDHTAFRVDWMPFAGHKLSGYGTGGMPYTIRDMQREKLVVFQSPSIGK